VFSDNLDLDFLQEQSASPTLVTPIHYGSDLAVTLHIRHPALGYLHLLIPGKAERVKNPKSMSHSQTCSSHTPQLASGQIVRSHFGRVCFRRYQDLIYKSSCESNSS
jgi:hypothetical protein